MNRLVESGSARQGAARLFVTRLLAAFVMVFTLGVGSMAVAQEKAPKDNKPQVFDFEEDEISTDYLKPNTMMVEGLRRGRMSSLISVRLHFVDEIVKSAEDI